MKKKTAAIFLFAFCWLFSSCTNTETGPDDHTTQLGYQKDIDWPTLADSPWPIFQPDPQGTGRSRFSGPKCGIISDWFNVIGNGKLFVATLETTDYGKSKLCIME